MRRSQAAAVLAAVALVACQERKPAAPPAPPTVAAVPRAPVPLAEWFKIRRHGTFTTPASFSRDEKLVAYLSDEGGRLDIWVQPVAGGAARQLTRVKGFVGAFDFSPTEDLLVFAADVGGDELARLHAVSSAGEEPVALFPDDPAGSRQTFVAWAESGKTFLYTSSRRDPRYEDLYEYDLATKRSKLLWQASGQYAFAVASRDQNQFAVVETKGAADSSLHLARRGARGMAHLTPHTGDVLIQPATFSPDGKRLLYVSDEGGEYASLRSMDLASRKSKVILAESWDVDEASYSRGWQRFVTVVNADGAPKVAVSDARSGQPVALPATKAPGTLVPVAFSGSGRFLVARVSGDAAPRSLWLLDLEKGTGRELVDVLPEALAGRKLVAGESVRIPSFDGQPVPALLYRPEGAGPFPALLDIHGGPTYQSRREFSAWRQYLVSRGFVVLVPNVRGSTGYGKTWTKLDSKDFGGGPLKDVLACKAWLVANAGVAADKAVVYGGSYGGYMVLAAATFAPTEFAAHVDIFGVSDLKTLIESFPPWWTSGSSFIHQKFGNPADPADAQYLHDRSPLHFAEKIQRPLLVIQGTNDPRVKKDQSDRIVAAARARNVPVEYLVIEGEGHGFSKTENLERALQTADRFLDRHLFGDASVTVVK